MYTFQRNDSFNNQCVYDILYDAYFFEIINFLFVFLFGSISILTTYERYYF